MVSPKPLSDLVPDVTLIAFPIPQAVVFSTHTPVAHLAHANSTARVNKMVLI
jgi:hypothetical protein